MDEKKQNQSGGRVIDIGAALEEKERAERAEEKRLRKELRPPLFKRVVALLLVLILVFSAVMVTVYWDEINIDAIRRTISYFGTEQSAGETAPFAYERGNDNCFAELGKHLAVVTNQNATIYDYSGAVLFETKVKLDTPAVDVGGGMVLAYEVGGSNLVVFNEKGVKLSLAMEDGMGIYAADLNSAGYLAVTAQKKGQKGCVTVYNAAMEKIFSFDSATRYVANACVSEDCKYMLAQTLGQEEGVFSSNMVVYRLDSETQYSEFSVEGGMVLSLESMGSQTLCVADDQAVLAGSTGKVSAVYSYPLPYLRDFASGGDGFAAFVLNRYRAGTSGKLVTMGTDGETIGEAEINEEVLSLSAAGRYLAVLYTDRLVVYNKDLTEYATFTQTETAESAVMRSDGSVWMISAGEISLLIP